jgi:hypothetical protein
VEVKRGDGGEGLERGEDVLEVGELVRVEGELGEEETMSERRKGGEGAVGGIQFEKLRERFLKRGTVREEGIGSGRKLTNPLNELRWGLKLTSKKVREEGRCVGLSSVRRALALGGARYSAAPAERMKERSSGRRMAVNWFPLRSRYSRE